MEKGVVKALQLDVAWHCFLADQVDQVRLNARNMHQYIQYILVTGLSRFKGCISDDTKHIDAEPAAPLHSTDVKFT